MYERCMKGAETQFSETPEDPKEIQEDYRRSPPQGRQNIVLKRPVFQHARDAEERRHEHRVKDESV